MLSGRPFLYFSLPGVAFILGVFWYRRQKKGRIGTGRGDDLQASDQLKTKSTTTETNAKRNVSSKPMDVNGTITYKTEEDNCHIVKILGKSAPIDIMPNNKKSNRVSPKKVTTQQTQNVVDSEVLKSKIQDAGDKLLGSIDEDLENLSSSVHLPGTLDSCYLYGTHKVVISNHEPVVIKATTTPKISPEDSFLESKYVKSTMEQNVDELLNTNDEECKQQFVEPLKTEIIAEEKEVTPLVTSPRSSPQENAEECVVADEQTDSEQAKEKREGETSSPSLSFCSVNTGDSGHGSSLPRSEGTRATYEFYFPTRLLCHLYGRKHNFIIKLKAKTGAKITLTDRTESGRNALKICVVQGNESQINAALAMIRMRLPLKRYPNFTMQRIHYALPQTEVPLATESLLNLHLNLIEGINNDVVVSTIINGGHIFVQQPLHPSHPALAILQKSLYESYTTGEAPLLPTLTVSAVCVTCVNGIWYRVQIMELDSDEEQRCIVKFLDFGGFMNVHYDDLRQIRTDFMSVPFQATECLLSNLEPKGSSWTHEATDILCRLTKGCVLQAQVAGYNSHNIPEIYLFASLGPNNVIFVNKELEARNLANWVEISDC